MLTKNYTHLLLFLLTIVMLVACQPQPPILVYVTPTQDEVASLNTSVPTVEASAVTVEVTPSVLPATAINTATPAEPTLPLGPSATFEGAVVAPGYTLPPTSTPRPTQTQPPPPTPEPGATQATLEQPTNPPPAAPQGALPNLDANMMGIQLDPTLNQTD
ncbi:MAG: hypothetical protein K8I30_07900, partial [Anaerolineae bacterium]|nr:hypothetical protein [Anaerolineae bacterium]